MGIFVLPWVIAIGPTGVYLNHSRAIYPMINSQFSEANFEVLPLTDYKTQADAERLAAKIWPDQVTKKIWEEPYHDRPTIYISNPKGRVILSVTTGHGHYYVKSRYLRETFSPGGERLHKKIYWGAIFKDLHRSGWLGQGRGRGLGTWIANFVGGIMVIFGITGMFMWGVPKIRKFRAQLRG